MKLLRIVGACAVIVGVALGLIAERAASAAIVADFVGDYQTPTPAAGWAYEWNQLGPIGTASNYVPLQYDPTNPGNNWYVATPGTFPNYGIGAGYDVVAQGFMHPGPGGANETFAIAAYTLGAGGLASIVNLAATDGDANGGDGIEIWVGVNNAGSIVGSYNNGGSFSAGSIPLGTLSAGDTIYVAIGAKSNDGNDSTQLGYQISLVPVPEPHSLVLLALGGVGLLALARRRSAR